MISAKRCQLTCYFSTNVAQGLKDSSYELYAENLSAETSEQNSPAKPSEEIPPDKLSEGNSPAKPSEENTQAKTSEESPQAKTSEENPPATPSAENSPAKPWQGIIDLLNRLLGTLKKNYVRTFLYFEGNLTVSK